MKATTLQLSATLILTFCANRATSSEVPDQAYVPPPFVSQGGVGGMFGLEVAQTFRVGIRGQLTRLDFWAYRTVNGDGDLLLDLRPTGTDGQPVDDDGSILAQVLILRNNVSPEGTGNPPPIEPLLITVDLSPFNLSFQREELVAFNFSSNSSNEIVGFGVLGNYGPQGGAGPYAEGQAFRRSNRLNAEAFRPWIGGSAEVGPIDLGFRTYVIPIPEPDSLALISIATWFAYGRCRRRRKESTS